MSIQGLAVLPAWTNITGRYALEPTIHQGFPVYRRITYLAPARSGSAADGGGAGNFTGGASPQPSDGATASEGLLLFYSEGNWVVAPGLRLVMDTSESERARLVAFSSAAYPHQVARADWQEVGLSDFDGSVAWRQSAGFAISCAVGALCERGLILPRDGAGSAWFEGVGGAESGGSSGTSQLHLSYMSVPYITGT